MVPTQELTCSQNSCSGSWKELNEFSQRKKRTSQTFIVNNCNTIDTTGGTTKLNGTGIESIFISTPCSSLTINVKYPKSKISTSPLPCVALEVNDFKIFTLEGKFYFNNTECIKFSEGLQTTPQDFESELLLTNIDFVSIKLPNSKTIFYAYFKTTKGEISRHFKLNPNGNYSKIVTQGIKDITDVIRAPCNTQIVTRRTTVAYAYLENEKKRLENQPPPSNSPNGPLPIFVIFVTTSWLCTMCIVLTRPCHDKKYREDFM